MSTSIIPCHFLSLILTHQPSSSQVTTKNNDYKSPKPSQRSIQTTITTTSIKMPSTTTMSSVATSTSTNIQSGTGPAPVDMAQPACSCYCGCQIVVRFPGGNLCEFCNENHNDG